jgi:oligoribonuclease
MLLAVDTETTGLDERDGTLLEVALVVLDDDLNELAHGTWLMPCDPVEAWASADEHVRKMHTKNGLWQDLYNQTQLGPLPSLDQRVDEIVSWLATQGVYSAGPMVGWGVAFDRAWLKHHAPKLRKVWNHHVLDVRGLEFLAKIWYLLPAGEHGNHRALDDILATCESLRTLRQEIFR